MRYNKIRKMDISNGPGVRVTIFFQGCSFHCKECFNKETWDFDKGLEFTDDVIEEILKLCDNDTISGLSILGGEPWNPVNKDGAIKLAKAFKERFKDKTIWSWSGYTFEEYLSKIDGIDNIDVIVDGQFVYELRNPNLKWKGSSNQRVIDVKKSLENKKIILYED